MTLPRRSTRALVASGMAIVLAGHARAQVGSCSPQPARQGQVVSFSFASSGPASWSFPGGLPPGASIVSCTTASCTVGWPTGAGDGTRTLTA